MKNKPFFLLSLFIVFTFAAIFFIGTKHSEAKCPPGKIWIKGHKKANGKRIKGHCVSKSKILGVTEGKRCPEGQQWVPKQKMPGGNVVGGYCK